MSTQPKGYLTPEQYLEMERKAEYKSEYYAGEMFAMSGARAVHCDLVANLNGNLFPQVRARGCKVYSNDMRVCVGASGLYTYPDLVAFCGEPQFLDDRFDTLLNPTLIIEVLSPSTEAYDRGRKFEHYRSIPSLSQYLLVSSERISVELFTRQPEGQWVLTPAAQPEDTVELASIGCRLTVADIYEGTVL